MVLDGKSSQEYSVNAGVSQGSIFGILHFWYILYINDFFNDVTCNINTFADDTTVQC